MRCEACGHELKEGEGFCPNCGAKAGGTGDGREKTSNSEAKKERREDEKTAGEKAGAKDVSCGSVKDKLDGSEGLAGGGTALMAVRKKLSKRTLIAGGVGAAAVAGILLVMMGKGLPQGSGEGPGELLYVSGGSVYGVDLKDLDKKPVEYTDSFFDSSDSRLGTLRLPFAAASGDGKYRLIPEDCNMQEGTFTLCYQKGKDELEKISAGVQGYLTAGDDKVVYVKNDSLYVCVPGEQAEKVDSDIAWSQTDMSGLGGVYVSQDGKTLLWGVKTETGIDYYSQDLGLKEEKNKLLSDGALLDRTSNFETLLFKKDGNLYLSKNLESPEKVAKDVSRVMGADLEKGTFFYTAVKERKVKLSDYVVDDTAEADAQITEPVRANYERQVEYGSWYRYTRTVVDDQYYKDRDAYEEKENRDEIRKLMESAELSAEYTELYFFDNGQETLITPDYTGEVYAVDLSGDSLTDMREKDSGFTSALLYKKGAADGEGGQERIKLSELSKSFGASELKKAIENKQVRSYEDLARGNGSETKEESRYFLYSDGADKELDLEGRKITRAAADAKNNQLYLLIQDEKAEAQDEGGELMSVSLGGETAELVSYDEDVSSLDLVYGGNVYYHKDVNDENFMGDFYRNKECVIYDTLGGMAWAVPESSGVVAVTDYDRKKNTGTLNLLREDSTEAVEIGTDIYLDLISFTAFGEDCIFMMSDYNIDRGSGDLLYFDGGETKTVESDVSAYFADYPGSDWAAYFTGDNKGLDEKLAISELNNTIDRMKSEYIDRIEAEELRASEETEAAAEETRARGMSWYWD